MLTGRKIPAFTKKVAGLPDTPSSTMTAGEIKAQMDAAPEELRAAYNGAMDDLSSTTPGSSGAEQIGSAPILGVAGSTPYAQIADVKAQLNAATTGGIPDGSITPAKLSFDVATQAELNAHTGATTGIHGATSATAANTLAFRDANGRTQFADPAAAADASTKQYTDNQVATRSRSVGGTYVGSGLALNATPGRFINVGFTPKVVTIIGEYSTNYDVTTITAQYAVQGSGALLVGNVIAANGFTVSGYTDALNKTYSWVAEG